MKLLLVTWNFPDTVMLPFDMYYFYWPLHEALLRGWEAEVLTFQVHELQPEEEVIDGIRVRRCPAGTLGGKLFCWPFIQTLLTTNADVIYCHGYGEGHSELAILLGRLRRRAVIFAPHFHVYPYRRPLRALYDKTVGCFLFNLCTRVIVFTHYTHRQLLTLGAKSQNIRIIPHVARPDIFTQSATQEPSTLLREAGVTGSPLLLGVGQLIERKGWEYAIRCLPAVVEHFPAAKLLIIGPSIPAEPAFQQRLWQLADELGVSQHLQILQDNTPEFILDAYRCATLVTHPSFVESFGMVILEAMTAGKPVVAHNSTGIPCIIDDGITGYVVDVRNIPLYSKKLLTLLYDPLLRLHMGKIAQLQATTRFSQTEIAARLFAIFDEALLSVPSKRVGKGHRPHWLLGEKVYTPNPHEPRGGALRSKR